MPGERDERASPSAHPHPSTPPEPRRVDDVAAVACALVEATPHGAAWLDGGTHAGSVLGVCPSATLEDGAGDGLSVLDALDEALRDASMRDPARSPTWMGWMTYDLGARWWVGDAAPRGDLPGVVIRRYDATVRVAPDGGAAGAGRVFAVGDDAAAQHLMARVEAARPRVPGPWPMGELQTTIREREYRAKVERAKQHIAAGETYQVNLSQRFVAPWREGPCEDAGALARRALDLHMHVRARADAPMGALLHVSDEAWFVSNSPETLLDLRHEADGRTQVSSWPIKGTRPRGSDAASDERSRVALRDSEKDLAEHVMIVDLVRNDLGRVAVPGSVRAPPRPSIVSLPTVHHFVSEVRCDLRPGTSLRQVFEALFPGGSITGAPKKRTLEIIAALEGEPRGVYCGAILFADARTVRVSIPIRTAVVRRAGIELRSGGGIVADSDPEAERVETEVKTRAFLTDRIA